MARNDTSKPTVHEVIVRSAKARSKLGASAGATTGSGGETPSKDFVSDGFARCKFIGYGPGARPLLEASRLPADKDAERIDLTRVKSRSALRFWPRELTVDMDA